MLVLDFRLVRLFNLVAHVALWYVLGKTTEAKAPAKAPAAAAAKPKVPKAKKPVPKKPAEKKEGAAAEKTVKTRVPHRKVHKAQRVQKKIVKGTHGTRVKKVRTSVHFHRPRTFRPARNPKYPRKSIPSRSRWLFVSC